MKGLASARPFCDFRQPPCHAGWMDEDEFDPQPWRTQHREAVDNFKRALWGGHRELGILVGGFYLVSVMWLVFWAVWR
jgi:hypothetical protein